jgi:diguanylate cyclase (GGDEF)-like protein/PAS domain S-box-containing protein
MLQAVQQAEIESGLLRRCSWGVLAIGVLATLVLWRHNAPLAQARWQPDALALLIGGLMGSLGLFWALRSAASRQYQAAQMARRLSQQALQNEQHLRSIMDHTVDGIITLAPTGWILSVNDAVCRIFGYTQAELLRQHISQLMPATIAHTQAATLEDFLRTQHVGLDGLGRRAEGRRMNGQTFPMDLAISTMEQDGQTQFIGVLRDLSAEQAAERAVLEAHRQLNEVDEMRRVIVHNAPYAIFLLNRQGVIQTVNPAGERLLGYRTHELVGKSTTQRFFDPDQVAERIQMLALRNNEAPENIDVLLHLAKESPGMPSEWTLIRADSRALVAELSVTVLSDDMGQITGYLAMAQDVTSRCDAESQVQHMALHDSLTALPNRNMLQEQLKKSMAVAEREGHLMALMFIDLDRFKKINDTLGHHIGDSVLIEIARRLRSAMRTSDIVARIGGDEFVVLLPRIAQPQDEHLVMQKVMAVFNEPLRIGPHELRVTPSIGLVLYPQHGRDAITLMRHADLAMYQAKNLGRNRVQTFSEDIESPTADTLVLENDLYKALERDELRLHFQPQFDCATGLISGAEALLRWEHGGKLVPPDEFIPLAEESGLIVEIGEWVLRRSCVQAQRWREMSAWPLRVAVNLSAVQLERPDIAETVARALRDSGLPATALELEITESVVVRESLRAADVLSGLRALGLTVAIDDFGVGYSSFAYLRELPVDRFKLDRSFLSNVPESTGDSRLTAALIAMAHQLEVGIVAEGVETQAQHTFLKAHGCDEVQGYHLGRPMSEAAFEALLMEHSRLHPRAAMPVSPIEA